MSLESGRTPANKKVWEQTNVSVQQLCKTQKKTHYKQKNIEYNLVSYSFDLFVFSYLFYVCQDGILQILETFHK